MKLLAIGLLALCTVAQSQDKTPAPPTTTPTWTTPPTQTGVWYEPGQPYDYKGPQNAHDLAIEKIREFSAYERSRATWFCESTTSCTPLPSPDTPPCETAHQAYPPTCPPMTQTSYSMFIATPQAESWASVDGEGKVTLHNMTAEDALLTMVASELDRSMETSKEFDRQLALRSSKPPAKLKWKGKSWPIGTPATLRDNADAITYCALHKVDVLRYSAYKQLDMLHEMMHVATNCDPKVHKAIYEIQAGLLQLLQDNPDMVDFLMHDPRSDGWYVRRDFTPGDPTAPLQHFNDLFQLYGGETDLYPAGPDNLSDEGPWVKQ